MAATPQPPLWEFVCRLYGQDGARAALLWLQDQRGLDIPFFLFTLWTGLSDRALAKEQLHELLEISRAYAEHLVTPLRSSRRWLKKRTPEAETLYRQLLDTELACERAVLEQLEQRFMEMDTTGTTGAAVDTGNADLYLETAGIERDTESEEQLAIAMAGFKQRPAD